MLRAYQADKAQTIQVLISDYFEKLDLKQIQSSNSFLMLPSSIYLKCIMKGQIITSQAILPKIYHSKTAQTLADTVKGKL